jgi:hypothetical protein
MAQSMREQVFTDIRREIEVELNLQPFEASDSFAPPTVAAPSLAMPDYVTHRDGATEIGKLSAEAVVREFEATAEEIEEMGADLIERVKRCEAATLETFAVTKELEDVAARCREEAKRVFLQIENCSRLTEEVRKTCAQLMEKLAVAPR